MAMHTNFCDRSWLTQAVMMKILWLSFSFVVGAHGDSIDPTQSSADVNKVQKDIAILTSLHCEKLWSGNAILCHVAMDVNIV